MFEDWPALDRVRPGRRQPSAAGGDARLDALRARQPRQPSASELWQQHFSIHLKDAAPVRASLDTETDDRGATPQRTTAAARAAGWAGRAWKGVWPQSHRGRAFWLPHRGGASLLQGRGLDRTSRGAMAAGGLAVGAVVLMASAVLALMPGGERDGRGDLAPVAAETGSVARPVALAAEERAPEVERPRRQAALARQAEAEAVTAPAPEPLVNEPAVATPEPEAGPIDAEAAPGGLPLEVEAASPAGPAGRSDAVRPAIADTAKPRPAIMDEGPPTGSAVKDTEAPAGAADRRRVDVRQVRTVAVLADGTVARPATNGALDSTAVARAKPQAVEIPEGSASPTAAAGPAGAPAETGGLQAPPSGSAAEAVPLPERRPHEPRIGALKRPVATVRRERPEPSPPELAPWQRTVFGR